MMWRCGWRWIRACALAALVSCLIACAHSKAHTWTGVVVHVSDGDTVYVKAGSDRPVAVRLLGLDAPEICQPGGQASRDALSGMVMRQGVTVSGSGQDIYGRELARLELHGQDIGRAMVKQGHAWSYRRGQDAGPYAREQRLAQAHKLGLFAQKKPEQPKSFRQRHGPCYGY